MKIQRANESIQAFQVGLRIFCKDKNPFNKKRLETHNGSHSQRSQKEGGRKKQKEAMK